MGCPIKTKYGVTGYLLEHRGGQTPYVVGLSNCGLMYLSAESIVEAPDELPVPRFGQR